MMAVLDLIAANPEAGEIMPVVELGEDEVGKASEMMMEGLEDAIAYANGDETRGRVANPSVDVRAIRAKTGKTREAFAAAYGLPLGTVHDWEQEKRRPDTPARVLLGLIDAEPETVERLVASAK